MGVQRKKQKNVVKSRKEMRKDMRMEKKSKQKEFLQKRRENKFNKKKNSNSNDDSNDGLKKFGKKFPFKKGQKPQKKFEKKENDKKSPETKKKKLKLPPKITPELLEFDPEASDFEDEEIDSDELSGNESETENPSKNPVPAYEDKLARAREKENNKLQRYEDGLKQRRIEQLQQANEEEDKVISKYEKLLKLNKRKGKKDSLTNFNDGLDYILELCTKDSIEKMYNAAKEAAEVEKDESDSDDEIQELTKNGKEKEKKKSLKNKKLEKIEEKYFGEDKEPEMIDLEDLIGDSDDSDFDENEENDDDEEEPVRKKAKTDKKVSFKGIKEADSDGNSDFDILDSNESEEEDKEEEEKSSKKRKNFVMAPKSSDDESEDDDFDDEDDEMEDFDENEDDELAKLFANKKSKTPKVEKVKEDIYGRKRDAKGNIIEEKSTETKYVPPHLRAKLLAESTSIDPKKQEQLDRLKKQLKGQINRLTEANVQRITIEIEKLYMQNARYDMNTTLSELICSALVSNVISKERMVLEHMLVVAVLHANIGSEIGAFFLENLVQKFNNLLQDLKNLQVEDKTLDNYVFMLSHMYTFKLFQHNLIYSILDKLCEVFNEKSVECILLVLRSIGFQLRKDDPLALKDLILKIQKKANDASKDLQNDVRVKFMLDILLAIKNNNMTKIPNYDPSLTEHFGKLLKSLTHDGKHVATLNISMDDLLNVDKRGKWWLVGSAWAGNDLKSEKNARLVSSEGEFSAQLLELASKQRMNTDDRRKTFCIIMSAEDYMDAFEKLMHLGIKDPRVIITVIIHCCLAEKQFNPYYAVLTQKFCDTDRKYQLAVQYALWDRIRELPSLTKENNKNLGKFISYIVQQGGQPLSVLKVIEFSELDKITHKFVKQIVMELLLVEKEEVFQNIFSKVALSKKLSSFKDSMKLFIHHFLLAQSNVKKLNEDTQTLLKQRVAMVDQMFQSSDRFNTF